MLKLEEKIKNIIEGYNSFYENSLENIEKSVEVIKSKSNLYTSSGLKELIKNEIYDINSNLDKYGRISYQKINAIIEEGREQILAKVMMSDETVEESVSRQLRINNAIELLKIEGKDIDDEYAYNILKDFQNDYEQLKVFKRIISKNIELEDEKGMANFTKTFGKFNKVETILNLFEEMKEMTNNIFVRLDEEGNLTSKRVTSYEGAFYQIPERTYNQLLNAANILKSSNIIDNFIIENA